MSSYEEAVGPLPLTSHPGKIQATPQPEVEKIQSSLTSVFAERSSVKKEVMDLEGHEKDLAFKIYRKQKAISRIKAINTQPDQAVSRLQRSIENTTKRRNVILSQKQAKMDKLSQNEQLLHNVEQEIQNQSNQVKSDATDS